MGRVVLWRWWWIFRPPETFPPSADSIALPVAVVGGAADSVFGKIGYHPPGFRSALHFCPPET